ncbi:hypothetical protein NKDENANG_02285 [Candidatus Entotheonellaceae bacterium PAL068K]
MVSIRFGTLRPWGRVGILLLAAWGLLGCATTLEPAPGLSADEVNQHLAALKACITTSQGVIEAALVADVSGGAMAPANSSIADAQEALDEARQLLQTGKNQEAMDRATQALDACDKVVPMAQKAREEVLKRAAAAKNRAAAEAGVARVIPCVESARRAIQSAEVAGASAVELAPARAALANAEAAMAEAKDLMAQGQAKKAVLRLEAAESDCLAARGMGSQVGIAAGRRTPAKRAATR